ncbi:MAG TPA: MFS transporter [Pseudonocardia sp.]|nr:MFS transporter [Pseudonocardia sp.]
MCARPRGVRVWSPWRAVVGFGVVSLAADMVYEGARSVYGPLLGSLGASALVVGAVTGAGEAAALLVRLVSGPLADRTRRYWALTIVGYLLTAVCVPLLAFTPFLGAAGLAVAAGLILAERIGKAVRSPAKSALLADVAGHVGMGRGLGVHKALDQVGAFAGPLLVAAMIATAGGALWPGLAVLAAPGAVAMVLLVITRHRMPRPATEPIEQPRPRPLPTRFGLPAPFLSFAVSAALCTAGLVTFGLIGFHLAERQIVPTAAVPLLYAVAMAAGALAALTTGLAYDRLGPRVLLSLPVLVAAVPPLAFGNAVGPVLVGVLIWGAAVGVQDSTVKALVADLVPRERRATAYGIFAGVQGAGALIGGIVAGAVYEWSLAALVGVVAGTQLVALLLLGPVLRRPAR